MNDDLEFSISQYLDGTLTRAERMAVEQRLEQDGEARAIFAEYQRLDAALKDWPLPAIRWGGLADSISAAVDEAADEQAANAYRMPAWIRTFAPLALAASVVIATGIGLRMHFSQKPDVRLSSIDSNSHAQVASAMFVVGPQEEKSSGPVEVQVAIGPSNAVKDQPMLVNYSDDVTSRPSHVAVASGVVPDHDTVELPLDMQ